MGITGLLPFLEKATRPCHVTEFRGGTVAVDSYCFLHKGANACAAQLARGEDNQMYVKYCIKYVKMLLSYDIHPIMVFDGRNLPAKAETEQKRRESRKKAKQRAAELLRLGKTEEAQSYLKQCVDITPKMAHNLIKECQKLNVDCIVAPYESDAQMAFFSIKGVAECVITEDSDLVLFGCKKILYKLDLQGAGRLVEADKICMSMKMRPDQFTFDKFRFMCILSGCDYVSSLNGIGLKKAEKFLKLTVETNPEIFLDRIPRYLNMKHLVITDEYKKKVLIANATFLHQVVFDPYKKKLVHLTDPDSSGTNPEHLINSGEKFDSDKAFQVAIGNLNPYNFEVYDNWSPLNVSQFSIWSGVCKKRISKTQQKKMQKSSFHKYMFTETDASTSDKTVQEEILKNEDNEINEDLSLYTRKHEIRMEVKEIDINEEKNEKEDVSIESKTSPVISKNPFLRARRISKFPRTDICGTSMVKSRFFCSNVLSKDNSECSKDSKSENKSNLIIDSNIIENKVNCDNSFNSNNATENSISENVSIYSKNEDKSVLNQILIEEVINTNDIQVSCKTEILKNNAKSFETEVKPNILSLKTDTATYVCDEVLKSCENTGELISKKRASENSIEKNIDTKCDKEKGHDSHNLKTDVQSDIKRRKLSSCKTVGLRKVSSQKTLHNFFTKLKKEC